ncbi:MAG: ATP-binding protein [Candidatus Marinimicrobia bacterium]|jgi:tRNA 2-thiocytidine biosynthesis protein TtcA|nr:ATP-binding protein [Candidatus Neomarinimicrobiota bacterium]MDD4961913.1 ATP-binding protein [Candidatus Neomarinimicrobiota bacterium]MDD5709157.1 ATP-binding protein [Candidatus Neomarinimicrobiota bacterium]MDX9778339.1 ATP-binding protein [bacterium]
MATKLEKILIRSIELANEKWDLFTKGERLVLGVSGGKDSLSCLRLLSFFGVDLRAVHVSISGNSPEGLEEYCRQYAEYQCITATQVNKDHTAKNPCFSCSRERRRLLLKFAASFKSEKIILGHHKDDVAETLMINMIYSREISTMMPKQVLFKGSYHIIRPMYLIPEAMIESYAREQGIPEFGNDCEFASAGKRLRIKNLIAELNTESKGIDVVENIFSSMKQIKSDFIPFDVK